MEVVDVGDEFLFLGLRDVVGGGDGEIFVDNVLFGEAGADVVGGEFGDVFGVAFLDEEFFAEDAVFEAAAGGVDLFFGGNFIF